MILSDEIQQHCTSKQLRCTNKRLLLADFLQREDGRAEAETLYMLFRKNSVKISQSTVYQMLDWMIQQGFVERVRGDNRRNMYCVREQHWVIE